MHSQVVGNVTVFRHFTSPKTKASYLHASITL